MKNLKAKYKNLLWILIPLMVSCTEIIEMEYTTDFERLVVDSYIMDQDTLQYVNLSKINLDNSDTIVSPISNALVSINDGDSDIIFEESENRKGLYVAPESFIGEVGKTYNLSIAGVGVLGLDGTDNYYASATMANELDLDSVTSEYTYRPEFGMDGFVLKCWAWDPPEPNYYLFKAWRNGVILTDTLYEYEQSDDVTFNGSYINGVDVYLLDDYKADEYVEDGDVLTLELDNIDEAYYDYLNSAQTEYYGTNPLFGGPPANVTTNVTNGAVGIFRVYTVTKGSVIIHYADRSANPEYEEIE